MSFKIKEITPELNDEFVCSHKKEHFMQLSLWGEIKSKGQWQSELLGLFDEEKIVGSAMLLRRKLPLIGGYLYYAPRGFVVDYDDFSLVKAFTDEIYKYLKPKGAVYLLIDPDYYYRVLDKYENETKSADDFVEKMKELGFSHRGFTGGFDSSQPRCTFRLNLKDDLDKIFDRFDRFAKKAIRQSEDNCIEVFPSTDFETFEEIMKETALRDGFIENRLDYYKLVYETLHPTGFCELLMSKYLPKKHLAALEEQIAAAEKDIEAAKERIAQKDTSKAQTVLKQALEKKERLLKLKAEAEENDKLYPDGIVLSTGININSKNRGWTVFGGSRDILRSLNANYAITYAAIKRFHKAGMEFMDFFGTIPNPDEKSPLFGIHRFKAKFSGDYIEFPGEFHLVFKPLRYFIWIKLYPTALKIIKKITRAIKK
ncbi:MAG: peptidoglycan bridge formation glycyltransferase FemA/FemB family protein [Oscillospiraceae bacterium]|nr:peptidoglycan bridge formation glycyltransferase FemA/FemB family protein [Oscillospiraceae bacterium]